MRKIIYAIAVFVMAFSLLGLGSYADENDVVYDNAGLFTDEEISNIEAAAKEHFSDLDGKVYIITDTDRDRFKYWDDIYGVYLDIDENAVVLIIVKNHTTSYSMFTAGKFDRKVSNSEVNDILDDPDVYDALKYEGDYEKAALRFIEMSAKACKTKVVLAVVIGVIFGLVAAGCTAAIIVIKYKKKLHSEKYPLNRYASLELTEENDMFAGTFITKKVINSGGSRSGGSGGRGGGARGSR